jgi:hypothetical protein
MDSSDRSCEGSPNLSFRDLLGRVLLSVRSDRVPMHGEYVNLYFENKEHRFRVQRVESEFDAEGYVMSVVYLEQESSEN